MNMLCNVDELASLSADENPLEIGQQRSQWLSDQVDNPDFIEFRTLISVKGPDEQARRIRSKAKEVGVAACPLADSIETSSAGGILP